MHWHCGSVYLLLKKRISILNVSPGFSQSQYRTFCVFPISAIELDRAFPTGKTGLQIDPLQKSVILFRIDTITMGLGTIIKNTVRRAGFDLRRVRSADAFYDRDGLKSIHNHDFMNDPRFVRAYERGIKAAGDHSWQWRVHIGLWAAENAARLNGDFVECGVNRGFLSSAIMEYLDWNSTGKTFYLLDTFSGLDERFIREDSIVNKEMNRSHLANGFYVSGAESVRRNFSEWKNVKIIEGSVPESLELVHSTRIAYLHIDMNSAEPEVAAFEYFWDRLVPNAFVLLDDYAYHGYDHQKKAMDEVATAKGHAIASLPTGQGLLIKTLNLEW